MEKTQTETALRRGTRVPPGERIKAQPWSFVVLALAAGFAAGTLWRYKTFRRAVSTALSVYGTARRFL